LIAASHRHVASVPEGIAGPVGAASCRRTARVSNEYDQPVRVSVTLRTVHADVSVRPPAADTAAHTVESIAVSVASAVVPPGMLRPMRTSDEPGGADVEGVAGGVRDGVPGGVVGSALELAEEGVIDRAPCDVLPGGVAATVGVTDGSPWALPRP
jgi:hypothetical protein